MAELKLLSILFLFPATFLWYQLERSNDWVYYARLVAHCKEKRHHSYCYATIRGTKIFNNSNNGREVVYEGLDDGR